LKPPESKLSANKADYFVIGGKAASSSLESCDSSDVSFFTYIITRHSNRSRTMDIAVVIRHILHGARKLTGKTLCRAITVFIVKLTTSPPTDSDHRHHPSDPGLCCVL
jgi:hypothetical protein